MNGSLEARLPWDLVVSIGLLPGELAHGVTRQLQTHLDDTCFPCLRANFLLICNKCFSTKGHAWLRVGHKEAPINTHRLMHKIPTCSWS